MGRGGWGTMSLHAGHQGARDSTISRVFQKLLGGQWGRTWGRVISQTPAPVGGVGGLSCYYCWALDQEVAPALLPPASVALSSLGRRMR